MRTALIVSLSLGCLAGSALAQTTPAPSRPKAPDASVQPPVSGPASKMKPEDTKGGVADALASCLEMWDRATHMSRQEWARACRRVDDRLKSTAVK